MNTPSTRRMHSTAKSARIAALGLALVFAFGLASSASAANWVPRMEQVARCDWNRPGHNPFMGEVVPAIDRYTDIPTPVRARLKQRMQARKYDDLVDIRRDSIAGRHEYEPTIRDMHFGLDRVCRQVTRSNWTSKMHERGLVYCEAGHCILVPTVCRNVSRIERRPAAVAATQSDPAPTLTSSTSLAVAPSTAGDGEQPVAPAVAANPSGAAASPAPGGSTTALPGRAGIADSIYGGQPAPGELWPLWPAGGGRLPTFAARGAGYGGGSAAEIVANPGGIPGPDWTVGAPGLIGDGSSSGLPGGGLGDGLIGGLPGGVVGDGGSNGIPGSGPGDGWSGGIPGGGLGDGWSGGTPNSGGGYTPPTEAGPGNAVPEPSTWALALVGLLLLRLARARTRRREKSG